MKKALLLLSLAVTALSANAQLYLTGTGPYTQNFNSISSGLPTGWSGNISSSPTYLGTTYAWDGSANFGVYDTTNGFNASGSACIQNVLKAGFKNYPSANVAAAGDSCTTQQTYSDRAFGVRQASNTASTGPGFDSGAAFVLRLANTHGMSNVNMAFKLQSLDTTSGRSVTWKVQYGIGTNPTTFTDATVTGGSLVTGGHTFSNTSLTASFGTGLDNVSSNVVIRIVALIYSSGTGNRPSTAIDDVSLSWTGTAMTGVVDVNGKPVTGITALGEPTTSAVTFSYDVIGEGNTLNIYDLTGRKVYSQSVDQNNTEVTVNGLNLTPGMYIAKIGNNESEAVTKFMAH